MKTVAKMAKLVAAGLAVHGLLSFLASGVARGGFGGFNPPIVKKCVFFTA